MDGWKTIVYFLLGVGGPIFRCYVVCFRECMRFFKGFEDLFKYRDSLYVFDHKISNVLRKAVG